VVRAWWSSSKVFIGKTEASANWFRTLLKKDRGETDSGARGLRQAQRERRNARGAGKAAGEAGVEQHLGGPSNQRGSRHLS